MMEHETERKYGIRAGVCALLLLVLWTVVSDVYKKIPWTSFSYEAYSVT